MNVTIKQCFKDYIEASFGKKPKLVFARPKTGESSSVNVHQNQKSMNVCDLVYVHYSNSKL